MLLIAESFVPSEGETLSAYVWRKVMHEVAGHGLAGLCDGPLATKYARVVASLYNQLTWQNSDRCQWNNYGFLCQNLPNHHVIKYVLRLVYY